MTTKIMLFSQLLGFLVVLSACTDGRIQNLETENGETFWKQTKFDSTLITALATNAGNIFAANAGFESGVFRSADNGDSWIRLNPGLQNEYVSTLAINSNNDIFAATNNGQNGRLLLSQDNGETWTPIALSRSLTIRAIGFSSKYIFIASWGTDESNGGIYRSPDGGENWTQISPLDGAEFEISPSGTIHATAARDGVFRSADNGDTWERMNKGIENFSVLKIAVDGFGTVYVATARNGIFRSPDEGLSWTQAGLVKPGIDALVTNLSGELFASVGFYSPIDPEGVYFSRDGGENWTQLNEGLADKRVQALAVTSTGYVFAGTASGVFKSIKPTGPMK
jgi:photosystem II stability/assembly factor-like uncharacterized protein